MKLSLIVLVAMVVAMSAAVAKADTLPDPSIHIVKTPGGDPPCPPDSSDPAYPYVCVDPIGPNMNSGTNPLILDASSLVNGYIDLNQGFVNSGGIGSDNEGVTLTFLYVAVLYPLGPPQEEFSCSSTLFLSGLTACPSIGLPGCPPSGDSFTCNTPAGEGYLEYHLTMGDLLPGDEGTGSVYEPEPSVLPLLSLGLLGVVGLGLRRKRSSAYRA